MATTTKDVTAVQLTAEPVVSKGELVPVRQPLVVQPVDAIEPTRPAHISDERDTAIKAEATALARMILEDPTSVEITSKLYALGSTAMADNTQNVSLMDAKTADVLKEVNTGAPVNKTLAEIKVELDKVNPKVIENTPMRWAMGILSYTPKGEKVIALINERRDSVKETVDGLKQHLYAQRDQALRNAVELGQVADRLAQTQDELQEAAYMGQLVWAELRQAANGITNPVAKNALENLIRDLAVQVVDIQTVDTLNVQSRMGAEALISNTRQIQQGVARVANVLLPALATNLAVKVAAMQQLQTAKTLQEVTGAAGDLIADTARNTRQATVATAELNSRGMVGVDKLQQACDELIAMTGELEAVRHKTEDNARATSQALTQLANTMRKHADPMTRARQAREQAGV